ncbi:4Fe-4S binding protein [Candidatus Chlorohelix sp.]|uniref:4Fe-4S binding protein n=1 Tax=Candidatus Chlorohelix sp. TaxID=3139201 RepID=UPI00302D84CD
MTISSTGTDKKHPFPIRRKPELVKDTKRIHLLRRASQVGFTTLIAYHVVGNLINGDNGAIANPEAYCPFGGLETAYNFISTGGNYVAHTHLSNVVLLVAVLGLTLVSKSAFCGWICPLGAIQDWLHNFRRLFFKKDLKLPFTMPRWLDKALHGVKYVVLAWLLWETAQVGYMVFRDYDPWSALLNLGKEAALGGTIILFTTLVLSLFVERPWCTYACPLGATIGLLGKASLLKIRRDESTCLSGCTLCNKACPSKLEVKKMKSISSSECVNCMSCVAGCPTGALAVRLPMLPTFKKEENEPVMAGDTARKEL